MPYLPANTRAAAPNARDWEIPDGRDGTRVGAEASGTPAEASGTPADPAALLRSPQYLHLLLYASAVGLPISAAAYGFLLLIHYIEGWTYHDLPHVFGLHAAPNWWPL